MVKRFEYSWNKTVKNNQLCLSFLQCVYPSKTNNINYVDVYRIFKFSTDYSISTIEMSECVEITNIKNYYFVRRKALLFSASICN